MAGKQSHEYPPDDVLAERVVKEGGSRVAKDLGLPYATLRSYLVKRGLPTKKGEELSPAGRTLTLDADQLPESEWTPERLLAAHGLKEDEWKVVRARANRWGDEDDLRIQLRIDVEPVAPTFKFPDPDKWKPLPKPKKQKKQKVRTSVVLSDFHAPHHDKTLFALTCQYLADEQPDEIIVNGDLMDAATVSRHRTVPGGGYDQGLQTNIDEAYGILRQLRETCPNARIRLQRGNHDERIEHALIDQLAALYGISPAGEDIPALSLRRLLHLDTHLHIEYSDEPWDRSKIQILDNHRISAVHGYSTTPNPGKKILADLSGSTVQGHSHRLSAYYQTSHHPTEGPETRLAAECGCMCEIEDGLGYTREPNWQQGFLVAKSWPDSNPGPKDDFHVALAIYLRGRLLLPDGRRYTA
jgi:predicted phosphodiesterase